MANRISGPGVGLPIPSFLYPTQLFNTPPDFGTNRIELTAGCCLPIPAGDWLITVGAYSLLQYLDPYTNGWTMENFEAFRGQPFHLFSPGDNTRRIANLLGCPISAIIVNGGTSFTQATATVTASVGGSTWAPIVGGALSVSSITTAGTNFTVRPLVLIPGPPAYSANSVGGIPAVPYVVTLTNNSVATVSMSQPGAGYTAATITGLIVPSPYDVNIGSITPGTVTFVTYDAGVLTGVICTNNGAPLATLTALTLTAAGGAGSGATLSPLVLQTITATSIVAGGAGWGLAGAPAKIMTVGGNPTSTSAIGNYTAEMTLFRPRDANIIGVAASSITTVTVVDGGLFVGTPTAAIAPGGTLPTTLASITFTMGATHDTVMLQPL